MKKAIKSGLKLNARNKQGQAIIEGACILVVLTAVFVSLLMFGINVYAALTYQTKLDTVAREAVSVIRENKYWIGVKRLDYKKEIAEEKARQMADEVCKRLGLPKIANFSLEEDPTPAGDILQLTVSINKFPLPFGGVKGLFPKFLQLTSTGVSTIPKTTVYAITGMACRDMNDPQGRSIQTYVPALGYNYITNTPTGAVPAGPVAGLPAMNYDELNGCVGSVGYGLQAPCFGYYAHHLDGPGY